MENSRPKPPTKLRPYLAALLLLTFLVTITGNVILSIYQKKIITLVSSRFFKPFAIDGIHYLPPQFIIIRGFSIYEDRTAQPQEIVRVPVMVLNCSLLHLALQKRIYITAMHAFAPRAESSRLFKFIKENFKQIVDFIHRLPIHDEEVSIHQMNLYSAKKDASGVKLKADFSLKIFGSSVSAFLREGKNKYFFNGELTFGGINIEKFSGGGENLSFQLSGKANTEAAEFKGFLILNEAIPGRENKLARASLFILDIDSRLKFALPKVEVERLNFILNTNPVKLSAKMLFAEPFSCEFKLASNFRGLENTNINGVKKIALDTSLVVKDDTAIANSFLSVDFMEREKEQLPIEKIELKLTDLSFPLKESAVLNIMAKKVELFCQTTSNPYSIDLDDLKAEVHRGAGGKPAALNFSSRFYEGSLEGRGNIKMHNFTPVINADIMVKDANANRLDKIIIHFSKTYGKLSAQASFINYPQLVFKGAMQIDNGHLRNFDFFKWLADFFSLPSLNRIPFRKADANFLIDKDGASLSDIYLDSEKIKIKGFFKLAEDDLVSSKISLFFPKQTLQESRKFTALLNLLPGELEVLKFDFQLSGSLHGMNFQLLQSELKDQIQKAIPNFIQRGIERKVENAINSISEEEK